MKILCVIDSLGSGGAQRQLVELAKGFKERGEEVSFLTYHKQAFYEADLVSNGIMHFCIVEPNYIKRLFRMRAYIRKGNFDVVLSFLQASNFICEFSGFPNRKWKLIVGERSANPHIFTSLKLRFYRWFHLFADVIVSNSHENLKMVKKINPLLPERKCRVIYNLVNPALFKIQTSSSRQPNDKLHVIVGASHRRLKNLLGLVKALMLLNEQEKSKLKISWYGDNIVLPYYDDSYLEALDLIEKQNLGSIIEFFPATREFSNLMANSDAIALFSLYEGLPNVVCEAMALGKPVLASNVSDIPILLQHEPTQTFNPNNVDEIGSAIKNYLHLDKEVLLKIGNHNRQIASTYFNKEVILDAYLKLMAPNFK